MKGIWIGLGLLFAGLLVLTVSQLFWRGSEERMHALAFKLGLILFLLGMALSVLST